MFLNITPVEFIMTLAIIVAGALLLLFVYQTSKGKSRGRELLPLGIILLSVIVIVDKLVFSQLDFLDWMTVIVFAIGALAGVKMFLKPAEGRD